MRTAFAFKPGLICQPQIGFMHQSRWLNRALASFSPQPRLREPQQVVIDDGREPIQRRLVTLAPVEQKIGDVAGSSRSPLRGAESDIMRLSSRRDFLILSGAWRKHTGMMIEFHFAQRNLRRKE